MRPAVFSKQHMLPVTLYSGINCGRCHPLKNSGSYSSLSRKPNAHQRGKVLIVSQGGNRWRPLYSRSACRSKASTEGHKYAKRTGLDGVGCDDHVASYIDVSPPQFWAKYGFYVRVVTTHRHVS